MPKPPPDLPPGESLRVTRHARDRFRERAPFADGWTDDEVDRCLILATRKARGAMRIDGLFPLDLHGLAYVRAAVVGEFIVSVTPKPSTHPGHHTKSQKHSGGSRKAQKRQDGVRHAKRALLKFHAQKRAERLRQEDSR